jgi:ribose transport system substrate-binding protein
MKSKIVLVLLVIFILCSGFSVFAGGKKEAAGPATSAAYDPLKHPIAMTMALKSHPVVQIMIAGFLNRAEELGYAPKLYAPDDWDIPKAYDLMEAGLVQHKIEGMVLYIFDDSVDLYVKKLADKGIPVVTGHTKVEEGKIPGLKAWAACDAVAYGKASAQAIGKAIGGKGTVAVTEGSFNPTEDAAAKGFIDEMKKSFPGVKVLDPIEEGFDTPTAIDRATAIIQSNPDIAGAFSTTGAGPSTWAGAQENTGKKIIAIAMDYSRVNLDLVRDGKIYAVVAQPLYQEFAICAELLDKLLRGQSVPYNNLLEAPLVTKDNVNDYYKVLEKVEEAFKKLNS